MDPSSVAGADSVTHPLMDSVTDKKDDSAEDFPQIYLPEDVPSSSSQPPPPPSPSPPPPASPSPPPSSSAAIPAVVQPAPSSATSSATAAPGLPDHLMYKNQLQEFAQKSNIALPMYQTVNEGTPHASRFRSTVWVNGKSYTTQITFSNRKAAEQDVARLALESLPEIIKDEGCPLVCENTLFSKSILNEYATKLNVERPTYNTVKLKGVLPLFVSSLVFNGTKYTGDVAKSKKEAEQIAARTAILSILGDSCSGTLFEIVKSKSRICAAGKPNKSQSIDASNVSTIANTGHTSDSLDHKDKEVSASMLPNVSPQPGSEQLIGDGSSTKKRRKNKNKANKKARLESPVPIAAFPVNEVPPCSVAQ